MAAVVGLLLAHSSMSWLVVFRCLSSLDDEAVSLSRVFAADVCFCVVVAPSSSPLLSSLPSSYVYRDVLRATQNSMSFIIFSRRRHVNSCLASYTGRFCLVALVACSSSSPGSRSLCVVALRRCRSCVAVFLVVACRRHLAAYLAGARVGARAGCI